MNGDQNLPSNLPTEGQPERPRTAPPPIRPRTVEGVEIKPPPAPEVSVRTLKTDVESVQRGEAMPVPEAVMPPEFQKEPEFRPETTGQLGGPAMELEGEKPKKTWLWIAIAVAAAAGLGALGYFVVFPLLFPTEVPPEAPPVVQEPPASVPAAQHQTYFINNPAATKDVNLPTYTLSSISAALQSEVSLRLANGLVKEVVLRQNGEPAMAGRYLNALIPDISAEDAARWFEEDFTTYLYYDANGAWPGYVLRLDPAANFEEVENALAILEAADLSTLYLTPPGRMQAFKDGNASGYPTRYSVGSQPGASFNYALESDYLILSTSFDGLKTALQLLGL